MYKSLEVPSSGCTLVLGDKKMQELSFPWWKRDRGDRCWWGWGGRKQSKYFSFGVKLIAAAPMANPGALVIYQQQNKPTNVAELFKHLLSLCKEQLLLCSGHGARCDPSKKGEDPQFPGSNDGWAAQALPQLSHCCWCLSPLWLPLNHTCQKELNPKAHKNTSETVFPLWRSVPDLTKYQIFSINVPKLKYT